MRVSNHSLVLLLAGIASAGCFAPVTSLYTPRADEPSRLVYVVTHGWHTGIAVRAVDVAQGRWPAHADLRDAEYLEIGWGNRDYWLARRATLGVALNAGLRGTPSALRVIAFDGAVEKFFFESDIVEIGLSRRGFEALITFIHESYATRETGSIIPLGPGPIPNSRYYLAKGAYHVFNNSNQWTAKALRAAGFPIAPAFSLTASSVLGQACSFGRVIRSVDLAAAPEGCGRRADGTASRRPGRVLGDLARR